MSSDLLPWASEYNVSDLPNYREIKNTLEQCGDYAHQHDMRITSHPGPFNVLTSPHPHVVDNCIVDLSIHGQVFDMMGLSRTPYNKINIHIGGAYGDKPSAMKRFCENFHRLPDSVKSRLTVEMVFIRLLVYQLYLTIITTDSVMVGYQNKKR
jgi:UV DNA damage endonuclease